jgi:hypothetical protein
MVLGRFENGVSPDLVAGANQWTIDGRTIAARWAQQRGAVVVEFAAGGDPVEIARGVGRVAQADRANEAVVLDEEFLIEVFTGVVEGNGLDVGVSVVGIGETGGGELEIVEFEDVGGGGGFVGGVLVAARRRIRRNAQLATSGTENAPLLRTVLGTSFKRHECQNGCNHIFTRTHCGHVVGNDGRVNLDSAPVAQLDRVLRFERSGWGFEPLRAHIMNMEA